MRWFTLMCAVAAIGFATPSWGSEPLVCLKWAWVPTDAGTPPITVPSTDPVPDVTGDPPDAGGIEVPPPPTLHRVCVRMGYAEDTGCSAATGLPLGGAALALVGLLARRPRRQVRP